MTDMTDSLHRKETERHQRAIRRKRLEKRLAKEEEIPKGYKISSCKCGNDYLYMGLDLGFCVRCLDEMEKKKNGKI